MIAKERVQELVWFVVGGTIGFILLALLYSRVSTQRVVANVSVVGVALSHLSRREAEQKLEQQVAGYSLSATLSKVDMPIPKEVWRWDIQTTVKEAILLSQTLNPRRLIEILFGKVDLPMTVEVDPQKYGAWEARIEKMVAIPGKGAVLEQRGGTFKLVNGEDSIQLNKEKFKEEILARARGLSSEVVEVPLLYERQALTSEESDKIIRVATKLAGKKLEIMLGSETILLTGRELVGLLSLDPKVVGRANEDVVQEYAQGLSTRYNRPPQDAKLVFEGGKVGEFAPALSGIEVEENETTTRVVEAVEKLISGDEPTIKIVAGVKTTAPKIALESINNLGINELIGRGESYYAHSIANRVYNVGLASSRVSGALLAPGEEFSFNKTVGEISAATGYRTAYVIQNGRTELGDGGGVCQVSTTLFRAAMNAGLPITERYAHAYRVGYYEQNSKPGYDATIFSPSKDFKFRNDTPGHILIQVMNDPKNYHLVFEIYGTSDGRVATVSEARVSGISPPPPDLYQDDPTLPAGQVKQVDWAAWGAKSVFDYSVTRGGETTFTKTFTSNYRPWANVYLRGTGQ